MQLEKKKADQPGKWDFLAWLENKRCSHELYTFARFRMG